MSLRAWFFALLAATLALSSPAFAETRVALVIGNANYANVPHLGNPVNDAQTVASALRAVGFSTVTVQSDLDYSAMRKALLSFSALASHADVAVVYFAGHGMEVGGVNYLIPVDAQIANANALPFEAVPLDSVMQAVQGARRLKLIVLDACRNNPFAVRLTGTTRSVGRGLARVEPESDTLVLYAARDGTTADDGTTGHSPFAAAFASDLKTPGMEVGLMLRKVHDDVLTATNHQQEPFVYGSMSSEAFYFVAPATGPAAVQATTQPSQPQQTDPAAIELAFWNAVADTNDASQIQNYLDRYPNGTFSELARSKLAALNKSQPSASLPPQITSANLDAQKKLCTSRTSIEACTLIINSGTLSSIELALAYNNRAIIFVEQAQYDKARNDLSLALALWPSVPKLWSNRASANLGAGQYQAAIDDANKSIELDSDQPDPYVLRGEAQANLAKYSEAARDLDHAISVKSDFAAAYYYRAANDLDLGQADLALRDAEKAVALDTKNPGYLGLKGQVLETLGRHAEAVTDVENAIALSAAAPRVVQARAYYYRCRVLADSGTELDKALSDCEEAIQLAPTESYRHPALGYVYYRKGDYGNAMKELSTSNVSPSDNSRALYIRAMVEQKQGDMPGCNSDLAAAKAIDPDIEKRMANLGYKF
jgi:tetratricopeptide (TPR) repeat protein